MLSSQRGMGLIETLLIVIFVAIGIVGIFKFQHNLSYSSHNTQQQANATLIGLNKLESLRDFQTLNTTSGYTAYSGISSGSSTQTVGNTSYSLSWTVTTNTSPAYKTIDITVSWTNRIGTSQSIRLTTRVASVDPLVSASIY